MASPALRFVSKNSARTELTIAEPIEITPATDPDWRKSNPHIAADASGRNKIQSNKLFSICSVAKGVKLVGTHRARAAVERDNQGKADSHFSSSDGNNKEDEDGAIHRVIET